MRDIQRLQNTCQDFDKLVNIESIEENTVKVSDIINQTKEHERENGHKGNETNVENMSKKEKGAWENNTNNKNVYSLRLLL